jgi:putative membrane protein
MTKLLVRAVFAALGLWLAAEVVPGVSINGVGTLIVAALLLGVVNAIVRPVVVVLTFPITIVTLGLFLLVVNAAMIGLVAMLLGGFRVEGLVPGVLAAIVTGLISWVGHLVIKDEKKS